MDGRSDCLVVLTIIGHFRGCVSVCFVGDDYIPFNLSMEKPMNGDELNCSNIYIQKKK